MSRDESNLYRLRGPDAVHRAVMLAQDFCEAQALPPAPRARLAILVEELVTNLTDHGQVTGDDLAEIGLERDGAAIRLVLIDRGTPFDPRSSMQDAAIPDRGGGAGLALVRAWADIVDYRSAGGVNRLELRLPLI